MPMANIYKYSSRQQFLFNICKCTVF